ncbi:hypothetical protein [Pseudomonas trivialis]|uniref:Uncharacterized protein n=1 Tax=Pseudomonas trivialis TaxID=200450 RepID=A0A0H5AHG1_9PSED|nr:hypothetical protein [Pseudomonas trivialis]AKS09040.1 hypothetical protein AA957_23930 [Pseudomonas trivialis]
MSEQANCLQAEMLAEMKKQTALLEQMEANQSMLIQALAQDQAEQDPEAPPMTYMDGTPCR